MNKRLQCLILAVILLFGSGMSALAASVNEVQKQQTETKNRLNEINKSITAIESKRKEVQAQLKGLNADLVETMLTLETLETDIEIKQDEVIRELKLVAMAPASDENGAAVKLGSKLRALELLGKHLGIFEGKNGAGLAKVEIREDL